MHGIYASLWTIASPEHLPHASHYFWQQASVPWWQKIQIHKPRWGRLWNKKLAYQWKMPYGSNLQPPSSETYPICHTCQDGASHMLAGCKHSTFTEMYINRHNLAVQLIQKAVAEGEQGGKLMYMDAGKLEDLPSEVLRKGRPCG